MQVSLKIIHGLPFLNLRQDLVVPEADDAPPGQVSFVQVTQLRLVDGQLRFLAQVLDLEGVLGGVELPVELQGELDAGDARVHQAVAAQAGVAAELGRVVRPQLLPLAEIQAAEHHLLGLPRVVEGQVEARHCLLCFGLLEGAHDVEEPLEPGDAKPTARSGCGTQQIGVSGVVLRYSLCSSPLTAQSLQTPGSFQIPGSTGVGAQQPQLTAAASKLFTRQIYLCRKFVI